MVEHTTHNRAVAGSIPASATTLTSTLPAAVERSGLVAAGERHLVALSGGPDSTALLLAVLALGHEVVAAHFDHALRASSAADAAAVARLCAGLGVPLVTGRRSSPLVPGSLQAAARRARYEFLEEARREAGAASVLVAHTEDDQVETVLMNLLRGTGVAGLRGIPARRPPIVRPLLTVSRDQVEAHLGAAGVEPLRDPSNRDRRHLRVRVRLDLLPALEARHPGFRRRLLGLAAAARAALDALEAALPGPEREPLLAAPAHARARAFVRLYSEAAGSAPGLARAHLEAMERLALAWATGASLDLPGRVRFRVLPDRVDFEPFAVAPAPAAYRLVERPCAGCGRPGAVSAGGPVHLKPGSYAVGARTPGLRMRPAGAPGSRKVQDILTDARVPRHLRDGLPMVFRDGELAWIPNIALDPNHATDPSRPGIHVELQGFSQEALRDL